MAYRDDTRPWYVKAEVWFTAMAAWLVLVLIAGISLVRTGDTVAAVLWYVVTGFGIVVFPAGAWYIRGRPTDQSTAGPEDQG